MLTAFAVAGTLLLRQNDCDSADACSRRAPAQNQSLAPADYWVSEATAWNYKMASEEKMYKLHDDQATSIRMYAENLGEHIFYYKEQVSVPDGKGGFKVRGC